MSAAPPLHEGESVIHDHVPSTGVFQRTALLLLLVSLAPTLAFAAAFADSVWVMLPLFLAVIFLLQERLTLGRHRAWITDRRVIFQKGREVPLDQVAQAQARAGRVRLTPKAGLRSHSLVYPKDGPALAKLINQRLEAPA